jgi:aldose 1-epimerase
MPVKTQIYNNENNITQYTISNRKESLIVKIIDFGATITHILVNDKNGKQRDVVLGFDDFDGYLGKKEKNPYFGAAIGRCANRIASGKFLLNGQSYDLPINNSPNSLHGGIKGFDKQKWDLKGKTDNSITFELISKDGDQHFPGTIRVELSYTVTDSNELQLDYLAELLKDQSLKTIINLTNHSYFNLNGCTNEEEIQVLNHMVSMTPTHYLEVNDALIPTGRVLSTKTDSPQLDFATNDNNNHTIGERIASVKPNGYDYCYVIDSDERNYNIKGGDRLREVVVVKSPITGITLTLSTTEPAFQFYTGNNLTDALKTKANQSSKPLSLAKNAGFCLEAQRFPNAINNEKWQKQVILSPNEKYIQQTVYKFSV